MDIEKALQVVSRQVPCPHETLGTRLGDGSTWARCEDCGAKVERGDLAIMRKRAREFEMALDVLRASVGALPTMADAMAAGDSVLLNEQAALLRECRLALDDLLRQKPMMTGLLCGSTTLGNLRAELYAYRPQGVFNGQSTNVNVTGLAPEGD